MKPGRVTDRFVVTQLDGYSMDLRRAEGGSMGTSVQVIDRAYRRIVWGPHTTDALLQERKRQGPRHLRRRHGVDYFASHRSALVKLLADADSFAERLNQEHGPWPIAS